MDSNHRWTAARRAAKRRDKYRCQHCGAHKNDPGVKLEVNHIVPLVGSGYDYGCKHHLDGLITLCHNCHVKVTTAQRRARKESKNAKDQTA